FRKPLIIMSPKSLLRHPKVVSSLDELAQGGFQEVISDSSVDRAAVKRVILCSGKVYYDLDQEREARGQIAKDIAFIRIEQFYPRPTVQLRKVLESYPNLQSIEWCQEEPKNMGGYFFVEPWLSEIASELDLSSKRIIYHGR